LKRTFTGPFWGILILEIVYITLALFAIYFLEMMKIRYPSMSGRYDISYIMIIKSLVWVVVLSGEAILYWRVRKRNIYRRESWGHVLILILAFVLPALENIFVLFLGKALNIRDIYKMRSSYYVQQAIYWSLVVLAHVFFVRVVVRCFKKGVKIEEVPGMVNILDDIGID
jgi:hypothetical protein